MHLVCRSKRLAPRSRMLRSSRSPWCPNQVAALEMAEERGRICTSDQFNSVFWKKYWHTSKQVQCQLESYVFSHTLCKGPCVQVSSIDQPSDQGPSLLSRDLQHIGSQIHTNPRCRSPSDPSSNSCPRLRSPKQLQKQCQWSLSIWCLSSFPYPSVLTY